MDRIAVGVDGSPPSESALQWAAVEAEYHDASVLAVMAWGLLDQHHADQSDTFSPGYGPGEAREALRLNVERAGVARPVEQQEICDLPMKALLTASVGADLLVVGARGLGGFKGLLLGSVSEQVLQHSTCPVAVVRCETRKHPDGPIVVGVDDSPGAIRALRWAAAEAGARGAELHVIHAWQAPAHVLPSSTKLLQSLRESADAVMQAVMDDPAVSEVKLEARLERSGAAQALIRGAAGASLIVIGSHDTGRLHKALLGSTSRQLAHHAPCPLVVVPAR